MYVLHADTGVLCGCFVGSMACQLTPAQPFWCVYTVLFSEEYLSSTALRCLQLAKMQENTDLFG